jgi:O-antigen/teichoic acid export membrane protein
MALSLVLGVLAAVLTLAFCEVTQGLIDGRTLELIRWTAPTFLLAAPASVSLALLQRELDFRKQSIVDILSMVANVVVSVAGALAGLEGISLVLGMVAQMSSQALLLGIAARPPWPRFHRAELRDLRRFGIPASTAALATVATKNIDYVIIGARLNAVGVGLYWRAFQLGVEYQGKISGVLLKVAFPLFSRARDLDAVRELRRRIVRLHAVLLFPLLGLLVVIAPTFVPWLYGERWAGAAELTQWLALAGAAQVVGTGTGPLMLAMNHPRPLRNWNVATLVGLAVVVLVAAGQGVTTAAAAVAIYRVIWFLLGQYYMVERLIGIRLIDTIRDDVIPAGSATLGAMAVGEVVLRALDGAGAGPFPIIVAVSAVVLVLYAVVLRLAFRDAAADVTKLAWRFVPRRLVPARYANASTV